MTSGTEESWSLWSVPAPEAMRAPSSWAWAALRRPGSGTAGDARARLAVRRAGWSARLPRRRGSTGAGSLGPLELDAPTLGGGPQRGLDQLEAAHPGEEVVGVGPAGVDVGEEPLPLGPEPVGQLPVVGDLLPVGREVLVGGDVWVPDGHRGAH